MSSTSTATQSTSLGVNVREVRQADEGGRTSPSLRQLPTSLATTTGTGPASGNVRQSTPTSTPPATVGVDVRPVHETNQATGHTEPLIDTGEVDALLRFVKQAPSPGTSQLLGKFEAIQEGLARRVNAQAPTDMPSSSTERSLSPETTALIFQAMQAYMDNAPAPQANIEALAGMPSSPIQQQGPPETRTATKRSTSPAACVGSRADFMSPPRKLACVREGERTPETRNRLELANGKASRFCKMQLNDLRALSDALTCNPKLDVSAWARARGLNLNTVKEHVRGGALTAEAQNRLDVADGKAPRLRPVGLEDLWALRDALTRSSKLNVAKWARTRGVNSSTVREFVRGHALTPEAQNRLNRAEGKASNLRKLEIDDLRALRDALGGDREFNLTEWARSRSLNSDSLRKLVRAGELAPEAQNRLDVADGKAPRFRQVGLEDLRALREALAHDSRLDTTAWARAHGLNSHTVRSLVRNGALRPEAWKRLQNASAERAIHANVDGEPLRQ
ncbi:hypothetical protein [Pandoraea pulmonicola]|nr:hypothetical protein [Pandoraea pulmonicola]